MASLRFAAIGMRAGRVSDLPVWKSSFHHTTGVKCRCCAPETTAAERWLLILLVAALLRITVLFWKEWSVHAFNRGDRAIGLVVLVKYRQGANGQTKELGLIVTPDPVQYAVPACLPSRAAVRSACMYRPLCEPRDMLWAIPFLPPYPVGERLAVMLCGVVPPAG